MSHPEGIPVLKAVRRVHLWYGFLVLIIIVFGLRLFYLQIIQYGHYHQTALDQQLKEYQIPAQRGLIEAHDGDSIVPLVLNQTLYTLYVDPRFITNAKNDAKFVASIIGGDASVYQKAMQQPNQYGFGRTYPC
jgi:cell division protein FtsI/penicillin-binding protein 2